MPSAIGAENQKMENKKKRWSDFSPAARKAIVAGGIAEAVVTTIALRDLVRRPTGEVRGAKLAWVLGFFVQPFGPLLYLVAGRRRDQ
jgi:Phospholipase_D-nuclease N-terminal